MDLVGLRHGNAIPQAVRDRRERRGAGLRRPYLALMRPDAPQRVHDPREVFNALRWIVRTGAQWWMLPTNFPPWPAVSQQARRWIEAGCFDASATSWRCG